ncbi:hypothetical protein [Mesobacillus thioparans]|uniref:hypothetical protein n=1 Tax=Mesobacillus thioparans TaxID=370439 RepID=UPI0039EF57BD
MNNFKEFYQSIVYRLFKKQPKGAGWTEFAPLRIMPEYIVDMEKKKVTGLVKHKGKVYLKVIVDVPNQKVSSKGNIRRIHKQTRPFRKHHYIGLIKDEAPYLIEQTDSQN